MHPVSEKTSLACYALSLSALPLARRLKTLLANQPWTAPGGDRLEHCRIFTPQRFCPPDAQPFTRLGDFLSTAYRQHGAHIFIGAAGIAVRALAPLLVHKSQDPPVLVLDAAGNYVISLISGHWGGGNHLARHVALLLRATPVITTASDVSAEEDRLSAAEHRHAGADGSGRALTVERAPALDLFLREAGLRIVDWGQLPRAQAALMEGESLRVWDPCGAVPAHPALEVLPCRDEGVVPPLSLLAGKREAHAPPLLAAHWRRLPPCEGLMRVAVPRLYVGLGCRKDLPLGAALEAFEELFATHDLEMQAVAALGTVTEKLREPALLEIAFRLGVPLRGFDAARLARCPVPNPSAAAGRRFGLPPFSVCEAAALLAARKDSGCSEARLLLPKTIFQSQLTVAVALALEQESDKTTSGQNNKEEEQI
ncbi:cobalamin biosynthesis protein [Desulfovibrio sp.]|uniref:cobalt-precorrin 5A hydrolase n=1 Tax=Desulfovibrio sp. TaxID=885 RepID=UPI0025BFDD83|nr:cobalamin biosynthesis protein [Desulfovibrio sp.]